MPYEGNEDSTMAKEKVSQMGAMRAALQKLGNDSDNQALGEYMKTLGVNLEPKRISMLKSIVKKERSEAGSSRVLKKAAGKPRTSSVQPEPVSATIAKDVMEDLKEVRELADRLGGETIRDMLDVLGK